MAEEKEKISKELKAIIDAIDKYCKKHKGNCQFIGSFLAFEGEDFDVVDDRIFAFGSKDTLLIDLKELTKMIKEEKEEMVNW